jgi:hypothetical protein
MSIQNIAIEKAIRLLEAGGATYHIKTADKEWGAPIQAVKLKRNAKYGYGALTNHFAPYLKDIKAGDVALIPYGDFEMESIRGALCGHLSHNWGNGSYMIHKTPTNIEVLRLT